MTGFTINCEKCAKSINIQDEFSRFGDPVSIMKLGKTLNIECDCGNSVYEDNVNDCVV